jgi:ABC-2 type transport system ATP-binding protein
MTSADGVLSVRGLRKRYGEQWAVAGVDLEIAPGEIFAFLGPNGAGKTTTVEILEGYRTRDGGEVTVLGLDPRHATREWRSRIGVVLQTCAVQPELTVGELLALYGSYYPTPLSVEETLELVGLRDERDRRAGALSGGQQRRLDVGLALVGDPALLFLDEPTTGFDPSARHHTWEVIAGLREIGKTVFLTTHYMDEAQALADRVAVIARGRIVAEGPPDELGGRDREATRVSFVLPGGVAAGELPALDGARAKVTGTHVELQTTAPTKTLAALTAWGVGRGVELPELEARRPTLEEIYLQLTEDNDEKGGGDDGDARDTGERDGKERSTDERGRTGHVREEAEKR